MTERGGREGKLPSKSLTASFEAKGDQRHLPNVACLKVDSLREEKGENDVMEPCTVRYGRPVMLCCVVRIRFFSTLYSFAK